MWNNFSEIGKKLKKFYKNFEKHIGNTFHKLLKKYFDENFLKFFKQFFEELMKNCTKTPNNFKEKLQRNLEEIFEIFWAILKICPGVLQSSFWH